MIRKILSIILIVIGTIIVMASLLTLLNPVAPQSTDTAYMTGYYTGTFLIHLLGTVLLLTGIRILRNLKRKKVEKNLLDSLPK